MTESAWPLRLALLVLGLLVIAGVYGLSVWRRRQARHRFARRLGARRPSAHRRRRGFDTDPEAEAADEPGDDDFVVIPVKPRERLDELPVIRREREPEHEPASAEPAAAPARAPRPPRPRRRKDQLSLALEPDAPISPPAPPAPEVVAIFVRPPGGGHFDGPAIAQATAEVGMRFGDMRIYHHFGAGDLRTQEPLFSVANMFEPGDFDPQAMADFSTDGLALFMQLPAELDGPVAFELFLSTAQRFAAALGGALYRDPSSELDNAAIERMRRLAARFGHGGA